MIHFWVNNQFWASLIGGVSMLCCGASYTWLAPLIDDLQSNDSVIPMTNNDISWVLILYEIGCIVAPLPVGHLADWYGRKPTILAYGPLVVISWLLLVLVPNKTCVYIVRFLQGVITTLPYTVLPFYLAEISEPELRGAVTSVYKIMWHLGMLYVYITGSFTSYEGLTYFMIVPCIIFTGGFLMCPESPYFLLMKNRRQDASKALLWLQGHSKTHEELSSTMKEIEQAVQDDRKMTKGSWKDLVATAGARKAFFLSQFVSMIYVMTGTCIIILYETSSVARISDSRWEANVVTMALGAVLFIVTLPSFFLADRLGRRPLLLTSCFGSGVALLAAVIVLYFIEAQKLKWASLLNTSYAASIIALCFITYGVETVSPILQSELFNSNTRGIVSGVTTLNVSFFTVLCIKAYEIVQQEVGLYLMYLIFCCFAFIGFIVIYFFLPETRGKTLEEIQKLFP